MDTEIAVYSKLGWSRKRIEQYTRHGGTLTQVAAWTRSTCPDPQTWAALTKPYIARTLARALRAQAFAPWAAKWKVRGFVQDASLFELAVVSDTNPFYAMIAFGASFEACMDLGVPCAPEVLAHAVVFDLVQKGQGKVALEVAAAALAKRGLQDVDVCNARPFDMTKHPLAKADLSKFTRVQTIELASRLGLDGVSALRECKNMRNDLVLNKDGFYVHGRDMSILRDFIESALQQYV